MCKHLQNPTYSIWFRIRIVDELIIRFMMLANSNISNFWQFAYNKGIFSLECLNGIPIKHI